MKHLISEGTAMLGMVLMEDHLGFECAEHEHDNLIGYFAKTVNSTSDEWDTMGHGYTYDLAIINLYDILYNNKKALPIDMFYIKDN